MAVFSNTVDKLKDQNQVVIKDQDKPIEVVMVDRKQTSADKEEQNEAARAEKKQTALFEDIAAGIQNLTRSLIDGLKKLAEPGLWGLGILAGLLLAPVIALAAFFKQLAVEVKYFKDLTAKLGKVFKPLRTLFNYLKNLTLDWVDDLKKISFEKIKKIANFFKRFKFLDWVDDFKTISFDRIKKVTDFFKRIFKALWFVDDADGIKTERFKKLVNFFKRIAKALGFIDDVDTKGISRTGRILRRVVKSVLSSIRFGMSLLTLNFRILRGIFSAGIKTIVKTVQVVIKSLEITFDIIKFGLRTISGAARTVGKTVGIIFRAIRGVTRAIFSIARPIMSLVRSIMSVAKASGSFMKMFGPIFNFASGFGRILGKIFLPITILMSIFDFVSGFMDGYEEGGIVGGIKGGLIALFDGLIGSLVGMLGDGLNFILTFLGFDKLGNAIEKALDDIVLGFKKFIVGGVDAIVGLFTGDTEQMFKGLNAMWSGIETALLAPINILEGLINDIFEWVGIPIDWNPITIIKDFLSPVYNWIKDFFGFGSGEETDVEGTGESPTTSVLEFFSNAFGFVKDKFNALKDLIFNGIPSLPSVDDLLNFLPSFDEITKGASDLANLVVTKINSFLNVFPSLDDITGFLPSFDTIKNKVIEVKDFVLAKISSFLSMLPSMDDILGFLPSFDSIKNKVVEIKNLIVNGITNFISFFPSVNDILNFLPSFDTIKNKVTEISNLIVTKINNFISIFPSIDDILGFLPSWDTITAKVTEIKNLILGKIQNIISSLPSIDDILGFFPSWDTIKNKVIEIKNLIVAKIANFIAFFPSLEDITQFLPSFEGIKNKVTEIKDLVLTKIANFIAFFPSLEDITQFLPSFEGIKNKVIEIRDLVLTKIANFIAFFPTLSDITQFLPSFEDIKTKVLNLKTLITTKIDSFIEGIPTLETLTSFLPDINTIIEKAKQFGKDVFSSLAGLFDFTSIEGAVKTAINIFFLPTNLILGLVESMWKFIKGLFGFEEEETNKEVQGSSFLKSGGIGGIITSLVDGLWKYIKGLFSFDSSEEDENQKGTLDKIKKMLNPMEQLRSFANSIKGFFNNIFDMEKIKGFFADIPLIGGFFGGKQEAEAENVDGNQLITPIDSSSIIKSIFGEVSILDELSKVFRSLIDNLVTYLDTFLGEALGPAYTSRAEHIEELESKIAENLDKSDADIAKAVMDYSKDEDIQFTEKEFTDALNRQAALRLKEELAKPEDALYGEQDKELIARLQKVVPSTPIIQSATGMTQRTEMLQQASENMATQQAQQQPVIISNVDNSTSSVGATSAIPIPTTNQNPDWSARLFAAISF